MFIKLFQEANINYRLLEATIFSKKFFKLLLVFIL
jgi:hypothetical protein